MLDHLTKKREQAGIVCEKGYWVIFRMKGVGCVCVCVGGGGAGGGRVLVTDPRRYSGNLSENP